MVSHAGEFQHLIFHLLLPTQTIVRTQVYKVLISLLLESPGVAFGEIDGETEKNLHIFLCAYFLDEYILNCTF